MKKVVRGSGGIWQAAWLTSEKEENLSEKESKELIYNYFVLNYKGFHSFLFT